MGSPLPWLKMDKKKFINNYLKKSQEDNYAYSDTKAMVSSKMQAEAEATGPRSLIKYLESAVVAEVEKIRIPSGTLNIYEKEKGLYGAFLQDNEGQVVEEFENVTIPILAKTLAVKGYYVEPEMHPYEMAASEEAHEDAAQDRVLAREVAEEVVQEHVEKLHNAASKNGRYMRIKYGDFELEIKKSMSKFVSDFRNKRDTSSQVKKALQAFRRNSKNAQKFQSDHEAAQALLNNWDEYGEEFSQILDALGRD